MITKTCTECGNTYTAWTNSKQFCGGLRCSKKVATPSAMRIVGLRRGNYRRSPLVIEVPVAPNAKNLPAFDA